MTLPRRGNVGKARGHGCSGGEGSKKGNPLGKGVDLGTGLRGQTPGFLIQAVVSVPWSGTVALHMGLEGPLMSPVTAMSAQREGCGGDWSGLMYREGLERGPPRAQNRGPQQAPEGLEIEHSQGD